MWGLTMKDKDKKPRQKRTQIFINNFYIIKKAFRYYPQYIVWSALLGTIWGVGNSIGTVYIKALFNKLEAGAPFSEMLMLVVAITFFYTITWSLHYYWEYHYKGICVQEVQYGLRCEMFEKAASIDRAAFDDPQFYNDYIFAQDGIDKYVTDMMRDIIGRMLNRGLASIIILVTLGTINPLLALVIAAANVISVCFSMWAKRIRFKYEKEIKPVQRKYDYIKRVYYMSDHTKELRISDVSANMERELDSNMKDLRNANIKLGKRILASDGISRIIRNAVNAGLLIWMTYLLMVEKSIMLGGFAAAVTVMWQLSWQIIMLMDAFTSFPEYSMYIERYRHFFAYKPKIVSGAAAVPALEKLTLNNISFGYKDEKVLRQVSMEINRGDKIAIVGYNGAGKTTLIKLLMRLYDVDEGEILWNGINIKEYDLPGYRAHIGAVFQDYKIFAATVAENVLGDAYDGGEEARAAVLSALHKATFDDKLAELEQTHCGIDTQLTREFDKNGVNLSGGESQKVAIARVFARPFELIIMDEPSSALDPVSEYNLNQSILEFAHDKTVIFISHRLSTTRLADKIYMFDNGRIVEFGSHDELMVMNGKYAEMFNMQAEKYMAG